MRWQKSQIALTRRSAEFTALCVFSDSDMRELMPGILFHLEGAKDFFEKSKILVYFELVMTPFFVRVCYPGRVKAISFKVVPYEFN